MQRTIEVTTRIPVPASQAVHVLVDDWARVLADAPTAEERRARRLRVELSVETRGGASVNEHVEMAVGTPARGHGVLELPLSWRPVSHERLLPSFHGELQLAPDGLDTRVRLVGSYVVPLGSVGSIGDGLVGRHVARRALTTFVEQVARRLDGELSQRLESLGWRAGRAEIEVREGTPDLPVS